MPARRSVTLLAILLLLFLLATPVAARQADPRLACDFEVEQVNEGEEVVLTIYAWDVSNLFAYQFDLTYDPEQVSVVDADPQRPGTNAVLRDFLKPDLVIYNQDDPQAAAMLLGASAAFPSEPVSGSGPLAQVRFRAEAPGEARFSFANVTLADDQAAVFTARLETCELTVLPVGEPTATRSAPQAEDTEVPASVATAVAGVVGSQAAGEAVVTGTPATGEPAVGDETQAPGETGAPAPSATPEAAGGERQGNFWVSALIGFAAVAGLAVVVILVLWWRWRAGGR